LAARLAALVNFFLVAGIWIACVFLTALKDYWAITISFGLGMAIALAGSAWLAPSYSVAGMLAGFSAGLAVVLFALIAKILAEYPYPARGLFDFRPYFARYLGLALGGF